MYLRKLLLLTCVNAISIDIAPKPSVEVVDGNSFDIVCTITKVSIETWRAFKFLIKTSTIEQSCFATFYFSETCRPMLGLCSKYYFMCDFTSFHLIVYNATKETDVIGVRCELSFDSGGNPIQSSLVTINVHDPPKVKIIPPFNPYKLINGDTNVNLDCTIINNFPFNTSYKWIREGAIDIIAEAAVYHIPVARKTNAGRYICELSFENGSVESSIDVDVLYEPEIQSIPPQWPHEGKTFKITCVVDSNPTTSDSDFKWTTQNNATLSRVGAVLIIENINRHDSGTYICSVIKTLSPSEGSVSIVTVTTSFSVDVQYSPMVKLLPESCVQIANASSDLKLECIVTEANPKTIVISWYKNRGTISLTNKEYYIIKNAQPSDEGYYSCQADNGIGVPGITSTYVVVTNVIDRTTDCYQFSGAVVGGVATGSALISVLLSILSIAIYRKLFPSKRKEKNPLD